jgi:predicted acyl esterase
MATVPIDRNVMVPMRDGVRLATEVYRPDGAPPAAVLLALTLWKRERVPY